MRKHQKNIGFTILELLIVTAVIGILSSVIIVNIQSAKEKASDAVEIRNLDQVRTALEMYYEEEREYPYDTLKPPPEDSHCFIDGGNVCVDCSGSEPNEFLKQLENSGFFTREGILNLFGEDVGNNALRACYNYSIDRQKYKLVSVLYNKEIMKNDGGIDDNYYEVGNDLSLPFYEF